MSKDACCHGKDARISYLGDCSEQMVDGEGERREMCVFTHTGGFDGKQICAKQ